MAVLACWRVGQAARCSNSDLSVAKKLSAAALSKAGARATNARADPVRSQLTDVRGAQILPTAIGVVNQTGSWSSTSQRHLQRVGCELGAQVIGERQPTTRLLNASRMTARYNQPSHVRT